MLIPPPATNYLFFFSLSCFFIYKMPFGFYHEVVCTVSRSALWSFFSDIKLEDVDNVPSESQPFIV